MTCDHRGCSRTATIRCRMGDGRIPGQPKPQTYVRYCDPHFQTVAALFVLCDIGYENGPNGPLPSRLPGRHPDLVARPSP